MSRTRRRDADAGGRERPRGGASLVRRGRNRWRHLFRRYVRPVFSQRLARLAAVVVPHLYFLYMRLVWATSRIESGEFAAAERTLAEYNGAVALLWHEELMTVAWGYARLGFRPHTLASVGESGEVAARILARCGFVVFRGGSSAGHARRRVGALREMITHMQRTDRVLYGLTVDGSKGPPYRMKIGGIVIARECGKPVVLARTWYRRCVRLPTWDRMAIPLPFNEIRCYLRGPFMVPASAQTREGLEDFRAAMEDRLIDLAAESYDDLGQPRPANLVKRERREAAPGPAEESGRRRA